MAPIKFPRRTQQNKNVVLLRAKRFAPHYRPRPSAFFGAGTCASASQKPDNRGCLAFCASYQVEGVRKQQRPGPKGGPPERSAIPRRREEKRKRKYDKGDYVRRPERLTAADPGALTLAPPSRREGRGDGRKNRFPGRQGEDAQRTKPLQAEKKGPPKGPPVDFSTLARSIIPQNAQKVKKKNPRRGPQAAEP